MDQKASSIVGKHVSSVVQNEDHWKKFGKAAGLDAPGTLLQNGGSHGKHTMMSLRIFTAKAINAPGVEYKSVVVTAATTAQQVIQKILKRFEDQFDADDFALRYVKDSAGRGKMPGLLTRRSSGSLLLAPEEIPTLVAERSRDQGRFELVKLSKSKKNLLVKSVKADVVVTETISPTVIQRVDYNFEKTMEATVTIDTSHSEEPQLDSQQKKLPNSSSSIRPDESSVCIFNETSSSTPFLQYESKSGAKVFALDNGTTLVGCDERRADILVSGVGVLGVHIEVSVSHNRIALAPYPGAIVYVDNEIVTYPMLLGNDASIELGASRSVLLKAGGIVDTDKSVRLDPNLSAEFFNSADGGRGLSESHILAQKTGVYELSPANSSLIAALTKNRVKAEPIPKKCQDTGDFFLGTSPLPSPKQIRRRTSGSQHATIDFHWGAATYLQSSTKIDSEPSTDKHTPVLIQTLTSSPKNLLQLTRTETPEAFFQASVAPEVPEQEIPSDDEDEKDDVKALEELGLSCLEETMPAVEITNSPTGNVSFKSTLSEQSPMKQQTRVAASPSPVKQRAPAVTSPTELSPVAQRTPVVASPTELSPVAQRTAVVASPTELSPVKQRTPVVVPPTELSPVVQQTPVTELSPVKQRIPVIASPAKQTTSASENPEVVAQPVVHDNSVPGLMPVSSSIQLTKTTSQELILKRQERSHSQDKITVQQPSAEGPLLRMQRNLPKPKRMSRNITDSDTDGLSTVSNNHSQKKMEISNFRRQFSISKIINKNVSTPALRKGPIPLPKKRLSQNLEAMHSKQNETQSAAVKATEAAPSTEREVSKRESPQNSIVIQRESVTSQASKPMTIEGKSNLTSRSSYSEVVSSAEAHTAPVVEEPSARMKSSEDTISDLVSLRRRKPTVRPRPASVAVSDPRSSNQPWESKRSSIVYESNVATESGLRSTGRLKLLAQRHSSEQLSPTKHSKAETGLRSTGRSIALLEYERTRRNSAQPQPVTAKRPERLAFADRLKLFQNC